MAAPSRTRPDVADQHWRRVGGLHADGGDGVDVSETSDAAHEIFLSLRHLKSRGRVPVRRGQRPLDFLERDLVRRQPRRIEDDLVLFLLASGRDDLRHAGDREQAAPDDRLRDRAKFQRRVPIRFQIDEQDLAHDRGNRREKRRLDVGGSEPDTSVSFSATVWRARLMSWPQSNSTQTIATPTAVAERTRRTPAAPFSADSIGNVTSDSISSGSIPGASARMVTVGAVRSGSTSSGMRVAVQPPQTRNAAASATTIGAVPERPANESVNHASASLSARGRARARTSTATRGARGTRLWSRRVRPA